MDPTQALPSTFRSDVGNDDTGNDAPTFSSVAQIEPFNDQVRDAFLLMLDALKSLEPSDGSRTSFQSDWILRLARSDPGSDLNSSTIKANYGGFLERSGPNDERL